VVAIFEHICQAVAYAHAHRVIHRDLKPGNVMVGGFGEVQVMDWGLAKVLPRAAEAAPAPAAEAPAGGSDAGAAAPETLAGSVLGTPAYMAPEQARGEIEQVDERTDVFGLGAILCEILTGRPPFAGPHPLQRAQAAELADAFGRLDGCGAEAELIGLAKRCLAANGDERPRHAGETAAAVTAYRESVERRLRQAEAAEAAEAARAKEAQATAAQERKARRLTFWLAASVLVLLGAAAAIGLVLQRQGAAAAAEAARLRESVDTSLDKAGSLEKQSRWPEAQAVLEQTRDRLGATGPADLRQRVGQALAEATLVQRVEGIRLARATLVEGKPDNRAADRDYATAFRDAGLRKDGDDPEATAARLRASAVGGQLTSALDDWATATDEPQERAWLLEAARRADPDPWRDRFRDPAARADRQRLEALAKELLADDKQLAAQSLPLLSALGAALIEAQGDAAPLLEAAQAGHPEDFWLNFELARALYRAKKSDRAVGYYRAAAALRPDSGAVRNNLAAALRDVGRTDEAMTELRRAAELSPDLPSVHNNLAIAWGRQGRPDEAIAEYRRAVELDRGNAVTHHNFGLALRDQGRLDEAIEQCRMATELNPDYAQAHYSLGLALFDKGRVDEAAQSYCRALDVDPNLAAAHGALGLALIRQDKLAEAREHTQRSLDLLGSDSPNRATATAQLQRCERLLAVEPKLGPVLRGEQQPADDAERLSLGELCALTGRFAAGAAFYRDAFTDDPKLAESMNSGPRYTAACCAAHAGCGMTGDGRNLDEKERAGWRRQAVDWLRATLEVRAKRLEGGPAQGRKIVAMSMRRWQQDTDLSGLRDAAELGKLPADEQEACKRLWADVQVLLDKAEAKK
ncbi:MAG TPA: serine/threonine-protein kinase, partial [Gemmataceae bacterium]|nr:serine/threonine-protein kinase [Gemmataceae bacterium]